MLLAQSYVFLEWLFFITKPSFLDTWPLAQRINALLVCALPFVASALALHMVFSLGALISRLAPGSDLETLLLRATPALIVAAIAMMLIDNFTYTIFGWGIVHTTALTAPIYWVLLLGIVSWRLAAAPRSTRYAPAFALVLLAPSIVAWYAASHGERYVDPEYRSSLPRERLPNIVLFAADGVRAKRMSAYGYGRRTTPRLDALLDRALVAENAFTNSGWTTSAITAMMTGKYPGTTKVLYPPYTLQGRDAWQSLPHILRKLGYRNLQESVRYYADASDLNWRGSFDLANGRSIPPESPEEEPLAMQTPTMLRGELSARLFGRLLQLARIERMSDPHAQVAAGADAEVYGEPDSERMARVKAFLEPANQPFFVQIHLMGTHKSRKRDLDEAIAESDRNFGELIDWLAARRLLDRTVVVYSSDHDDGWDFRSQVPLIFLFPGGEHRGRLRASAQLLDVAPTLLEYLGVAIPDWMEGRSLLADDLEHARPIFSVFRMNRQHFETEKGDTLAHVVDLGPPTYGLSIMGMVFCQRWYLLDLKKGRIASDEIEPYPEACPEAQLLDSVTAEAMIRDHLSSRGFSF